MPPRQSPPPAGPARRRPGPVMPNSWIWLVILATVVVGMVLFAPLGSGGMIDYTDFLKLVEKKQVSKLTIVGKNKIVLEDLLIGEVWLGSGQSNMQWSINQSKGAKEYTAAAEQPLIRLFNVPLVQNSTPAKDVKANWAVNADD